MILAIDLGTKTGYAYYDSVANTIESGWFKNRSSTKQLHGHLIINFNNWLETYLKNKPTPVIYYEYVNFNQKIAAHLYGAFKATLEAYCINNNIKLVPVNVGTIKRHATGNGRAEKAEMMRYASKLLQTEINDDNQADAICLLDYALKMSNIK